MTEFKPGDKVLIHGTIEEGLGPHLRYISLGNATVSTADVGEVIPAPTEPTVPYTDPRERREGDEVEVTPAPIRGRVRINGAHSMWIEDPDGRLVMGAVDFQECLHEGRVTLVSRVAPTYLPGRIYRDADGDSWFRTADEIQPWLLLARDGNALPAITSVPSDPVLCDVVPAGEDR